MKRALLNLALITVFLLSAFEVSFGRDSTAVGPGVVYYHDEIVEGGPWNFDILKIDMTNPYLHLESVKANDNLFSFERMSSAAKRYDKEGHRIIGAINGDFYNTSTGEPTNLQIVNGEVIYKPINRVAFAIDEMNRPLIDAFTYSASVTLGSNTKVTFDNLNRPYSGDKTTFYNSYYGISTGAPKGTTELVLAPVGGWSVNAPTKCVIKKIDSLGNMGISKTYAVISSSAASKSLLLQAKAGDTVTVSISVKPSQAKLTQAIGGNVRLVENGMINNDNGDRHPRTAIGFSKDSLTIYFVTVDGRQPNWSVGMSYYELGKYLKEKWNVYQAINVDGGGSTTMVVRGEIKNRPSDGGGERTVSNGLFVVSSAPTGPFKRLGITPNEVFLIRGASIQFSTRSYDEFYNPLTIPGQAIKWSCDTTLGSIDASGKLTTKTDAKNGFVYAQSDSVKDSVLVYISGVSKLILTPDPIILQAGQVQEITPKAFDAYGNSVSIPKNAFTWIVEGAVGTITADGVFTAAGISGEGRIIARYEEVADTIDVKIGIEQYVIIDDFSGAMSYTISGTKVDLNLSKYSLDHTKYFSVPTSGRLDYALLKGGTSTLNLNCNVPISGTPSAIGVNIYGDGKAHWLRCEFSDKNDKKFLIDITPEATGIDWENEWRYIEVPFSKAIPSWANPSAVLTFPVTLKRFYIAEPKDTKKDTSTLYFDDLKVHFIATSVKENKDNSLPKEFGLGQNYPNPFNPETSIEFSVPERSDVELSIFDIRGAKVITLAKGSYAPGRYTISWNASRIASGVYIYSLKAGTRTITKKMQLIK